VRITQAGLIMLLLLSFLAAEIGGRVLNETVAMVNKIGSMLLGSVTAGFNSVAR
jgi:hypothetical protein